MALRQEKGGIEVMGCWQLGGWEEGARWSGYYFSFETAVEVRDCGIDNFGLGCLDGINNLE